MDEKEPAVLSSDGIEEILNLQKTRPDVEHRRVLFWFAYAQKVRGIG